MVTWPSRHYAGAEHVQNNRKMKIIIDTNRKTVKYLGWATPFEFSTYYQASSEMPWHDFKIRIVSPSPLYQFINNHPPFLPFVFGILTGLTVAYALFF